MYIGIVHTHAHRTGFPVKFLQPYGTFVPVPIFAYQAKERLPETWMKLLAKGDHTYLHMYSFNIKGFLITH